jgi:hypothetical protein
VAIEILQPFVRVHYSTDSYFLQLVVIQNMRPSPLHGMMHPRTDPA